MGWPKTGPARVTRPRSTDRLGQSRFKGGQRGEDDVADDLEAPRADGIERVTFGVPRLVFEVDDVDRWHAGF